MSQLSLLVLAAGLGSRYGGIKQMDPVGPEGEFVIDYSVYDAWRAGFRKVVFIIREELEAPLKEHFAANLAGRMDMEFVCQRLTDLPDGLQCPATRQKPWGTGHAIWCARNVLQGQFACINADDFYGAESFRVLADFLQSEAAQRGDFALVAYQLAKTLSDFGTVSRGICRVEDGKMQDVVERTSIRRNAAGQVEFEENGQKFPLTGEEPTSLNLWGFSETLFPHLDRLFKEFLKTNLQEPKKEFFIPTVVDTLVKGGIVQVHALPTTERWFGMTYPEDRQLVVENIAKLTAQGLYPARLWERH